MKKIILIALIMGGFSCSLNAKHDKHDKKADKKEAPSTPKKSVKMSQKDKNDALLEAARSLSTRAKKKHEDYKIIRDMTALIDSGADVNAQDENGLTALHIVAMKKRKDAVEPLLLKKADPNTQDKQGFTALHYVVGMKIQGKRKEGEEETVALAVPIGVPASVVSALGGAIEGGEIENDHDTISSWKTIRKELLHKTDLGLKTKEGLTVLDVAVMSGEHSSVQQILKEADKNEKETLKSSAVHGKTALHEAASLGRKGVVKDLLNAGFDKNAADKDGMTPLQHAEKKGKKDVMSILKK